MTGLRLAHSVGTLLPPLEQNQRGATVDLLDHGHIRLVDYMGADLSVIRAARNSYDAPWRAGVDEDKDERLLRRLWTGGDETRALAAPAHATPFEAVTFTFEVKAPIFVFRQWHRHRTQSYNELSLRYMEHPTDEYYVPDPAKIGEQSTLNKQGRESPALDFAEAEVLHQKRNVQVARYQNATDKAFAVYHDLLEAGWPREVARGVLPVSVYSSMFTTGNLRNFFGFMSLRCDPHAQWEIREYAYAMLSLVNLVAPRSVAKWVDGQPFPPGE